MQQLFSLAEQIRKCTACLLHKKRFLAVPGEGPENAEIMFIGEAPGREEDRQGLPFVGRSGKFLNKLLKEVEIERKNIFLTGAVKCRPEKNRTPNSSELKKCKELWLEKQIEAIKPKLIVILGNIALKSLLNKNNLQELHGKFIRENGQEYLITFHPAAGMRFPKVKELMTGDFLKLRKVQVFNKN